MSNRRTATRLPRWQEWSVYGSFGLLLASGLVWLVLDEFVRIAGEFGSEPHPAEHTALVVHGVAAYAFLVVGGAMLPVHVALGWSTKRNLKSGIAFVAVLLLLAASALGLYYLGDDLLRGQVSLIHWATGLLAPPLLCIHVLRGRSSALTIRPPAE